MKRFLLSVGMGLITLMSYAPTSHAWTVSITNNCTPGREITHYNGRKYQVYYNGPTSWSTDLRTEIWSDWLYWTAQETVMSLNYKESKTFTISNKLCSSFARYNHQKVYCSAVPKIPCCWDVKYELTGVDGSCKLERR